MSDYEKAMKALPDRRRRLDAAHAAAVARNDAFARTALKEHLDAVEGRDLPEYRRHDVEIYEQIVENLRADLQALDEELDHALAAMATSPVGSAYMVEHTIQQLEIYGVHDDDV